MTRKEDLHVVKPTTTVDEGISGTSACFLGHLTLSFPHLTSLPLCKTALELLVENRITGFPVIDDTWKLVGFLETFFGCPACSFSIMHSLS